MPDVYFGAIYVNLIKENFPRLKRALFHDPHAEPQGHISFELYEELDTKHSLLKTQLEEEKVKASEMEMKLHEEINKLNRDCEDVKVQLDKACNELKELKTSIRPSAKSTAIPLKVYKQQRNQRKSLKLLLVNTSKSYKKP